MKSLYCTLALLGTVWTTFAQTAEVKVKKDGDGMRLVVKGKDFFINGMNWGYYPIGTNYTYSLWEQPESTIRAALANEMTMLQNMGVNTIRIYEVMPKKWIAYIYQQYGIYTMLNHPFGRYGLTIEGEWVAHTDYADPKVRELLLKETAQLAENYKDTPGLLCYLLGNENNYGLFWEASKADSVPAKSRKADLKARAIYKLFLTKEQEPAPKPEGEGDTFMQRARAMYQLFNEAALAMKAVDDQHPIALCNGDLMHLDIVKEACPDIDIFGTNIYRGFSFGDTFQRVKVALDKPIMLTELGADAYNAKEEIEDQESQAYYLLGSWKEIYTNAAGIGGAGNAIGGFTFQFSDDWWKVDQTNNLDVHDRTASWNNGGYYRDDNGGQNNMNEEWFGICAKGQLNAQGLYKLFPRAAYFALKKVYQFPPYHVQSTLIELEKHFSQIKLEEALKEAEDYGE